MTYVKLEDVLNSVIGIRAANAGNFERSGAVWEAYDKAVLDCHEALRSLPTDDGWEDIATAKQDDEWIIACRAGQEGSIGPVRWWRGRWTMPDGETWKAGWLTHWKPLGPLPAPPATETKPAAQEMSTYGKIDMGYEA